MMTSTLSTPQQQTDGRTVREIVENNHELVNEPWCRRIFRQVLQSLELQYAMQMPHRPITPDTVLVLDSGDPMLVPTPGTEPGEHLAADLHDLAAVVHFAITREPEPRTQLRGRVTNEYSDSFVNAVDRCLAPDPGQRPQTIEQLRNLLGIVVLGPAMPAPAQGTSGLVPQAAYPDPSNDPEPAFAGARADEPGRMQRWMMLVAAATVLLAALAALFALLHQADSRDTLALALPAEGRTAPAPPPSSAAPPPDASPAASAALQAGAPAALPAPPVPPPAAARGANAAPPSSVTILPVGSQAGATYKLVIKPWGRILVNGVERGVSPPLKRLTLPSGEHTIRIINPSFPEHTVTVQSVKGETAVIELDFTEEEAP